ncbi:MAG: ComEC/Rec2 family competence protein [Planctomycetota bacterium]|nr:ComEC/Rec2 family competence protein [Planctomycetota bacterium]
MAEPGPPAHVRRARATALGALTVCFLTFLGAGSLLSPFAPERANVLAWGWALAPALMLVAAGLKLARADDRGVRAILTFALLALCLGLWHTRLIAPGVPIPPGPVTLRGVVASELSGPYADATRARWARVRLTSPDTDGTVLLGVAPDTSLRPGDEVEFSGELRPRRVDADDHARAWTDAQDGLIGAVRAESLRTLAPTGELHARLASARSALLSRLEANLERAMPDDADARALVGQLVLGLRPPAESLVPAEVSAPADADAPEALGPPVPVREAFARVGLAHVLSVSGFHVSVIALAASAMLRGLGVRASAVGAGVLGGVILFYAWLVPTEAPIVRSAALALAILLAGATGRRFDTLTMLGWTGVGLLLWRPADAMDLGWQLSVGLTAAMSGLATPIGSAMVTRCGLSARGARGRGWSGLGAWHGWPGVVTRKVLVSLVVTLIVSAVCWVVALPVLIERTGLVSVLGIPASIVISPLVVALLAGGFALVLLGLALPGVLDLAGPALSACADLTVALVRWTESLPGAWFMLPPASGVWALGASAALIFLLGTRRFVRTRLIAVLLAALSLAGLWTLDASRARAEPLTVHVPAFSRGAGVLVTKGGEAALIDPQGEPVALDRFLRPRAWRVARVILTGPDAGLSLEPLLRRSGEAWGVREVLCAPAALAALGERAGLLRAAGMTVRELTADEQLTLANEPVTIRLSASGRAAVLADQTLIVRTLRVADAEPMNLRADVVVSAGATSAFRRLTDARTIVSTRPYGAGADWVAPRDGVATIRAGTVVSRPHEPTPPP